MTVVSKSTVTDLNKVRIGGLSPVFRTVDAGKVRVGGLSPVFRTANASNVRTAKSRPS